MAPARCEHPLFDHVIRRHKQRRRHGEAERLRGLDVDHQFELVHHGHVGRLFTLENPDGKHAGEAQPVGPARAVAHQAAGNGKGTPYGAAN
jgi:hypothetical protein